MVDGVSNDANRRSITVYCEHICLSTLNPTKSQSRKSEACQADFFEKIPVATHFLPNRQFFAPPQSPCIGAKIRMSRNSSNQTTVDSKRSTWVTSPWLDWLGVIAIFFVYAGGHVPGVNEPHYWTKATHFWNPKFGAGDLFLESGDAHWLFFATFGALTMWLPLHWAVWVGRFVSWGLLSAGWTWMARMVFCHSDNDSPSNSQGSSLIGPPRALIATCWSALWLAGLHWGHWAGEWVVGGCEAKVIAYAAVFAAIGFAIGRRWTTAWVFIGIAGAFHVITGAWIGLCFLIVSWWMDAQRNQFMTWLRMHLPGLVVCGLLALVGVIPALIIDFGVDSSVAVESALYQVYTRLGHHLSPTHFAVFRWQSFGIELAIGILVFWIARQSTHRPIEGLQIELPATHRWPRGLSFVIGCALFALAVATIGLAIDLTVGLAAPRMAAKVLRFYWFRWNDVALPMAISAVCVGLSYGAIVCVRERWQTQVSAAIGTGIAVLLLLGFRFDENYNEQIPYGERANLTSRFDTAEDQMKQYHDWLRVCRWIRENTPNDSLWLTPRRQQSFKWQTGRAELVSWKDMPQDANSLVEWSKRVDACFKYDAEKILQPWTTEQLWEFHRTYGVRYVLLDRRTVNQRPPLLSIVYPEQSDMNDSFAVFEFPNMPVNANSNP